MIYTLAPLILKHGFTSLVSIETVSEISFNYSSVLNFRLRTLFNFNANDMNFHFTSPLICIFSGVLINARSKKNEKRRNFGIVRECWLVEFQKVLYAWDVGKNIK